MWWSTKNFEQSIVLVGYLISLWPFPSKTPSHNSFVRILVKLELGKKAKERKGKPNNRTAAAKRILMHDIVALKRAMERRKKKGTVGKEQNSNKPTHAKPFP